MVAVATLALLHQVLVTGVYGIVERRSALREQRVHLLRQLVFTVCVDGKVGGRPLAGVVERKQRECITGRKQVYQLLGALSGALDLVVIIHAARGIKNQDNVCALLLLLP